MAIQTFTEERKTVVKLETERIPNTRFVKWWLTRTITIDGKSKKELDCGVTCIENIKTHSGIEKPNSICYIPDFYENKGIVAAIQKEKFEDVLKAELYIADAIEKIDAKNISNDDYMLVLWDYGCHLVKSLTEHYIPLPIHVDYIDGVLDNYYYDLDKSLKIIKSNKYVINANNVSISYIPGYNADEFRDRYISFNILVPARTYNKLISIYKTQSKFDMYKTLLDMYMGLKRRKVEK